MKNCRSCFSILIFSDELSLLYRSVEMSRSMDDDFTYFVKILDDNGDRYYLKSSIDERVNTIIVQVTNLQAAWSGTCEFLLDRRKGRDECLVGFLVNQQQVRSLAKKFPAEEHDTFYSHTQRAFSKGNYAEAEGRTYVFTCKKVEKNRLEVSSSFMRSGVGKSVRVSSMIRFSLCGNKWSTI